MSTTTTSDRIKHHLILFSISFASFMVNLDTYIVNISLPGIAHYFNANPQDVAWVVLGYNLTVASLLIIIGRMGDKLGLKRVFIAGFALFTISSLICGMAKTVLVLVLGRCFQGIGASMLYAMTPAMVPHFLPEKMRAPAFGTLATAAALGITVGTPLGGIITGFSSWQWIFLINIPVGIIAILLSLRVIPDEKEKSKDKNEKGFDVPGALLSFAASLCFIYGVSKGNDVGWTSHLIIGCFIVSAISLWGFIVWEGRVRDPLLDLSLFKDRAFTFGNSASIVALAYLAGNNFLMPFYLMLVKGMKAEIAGSVFLIYSVIYMFVGPLAGKLATKINPRMLCTAAMALCALNAFAFSFLLESSTLIPVILYFVCMALSYGTFITANNTVVMSMAPRGRQGVVAGTYRMGNRLGMACGVCFFSTVFTLAAFASTHTLAKSYASLSRDLLLAGFRDAYIGGGCILLIAFMFSQLARTRQIGEEKNSLVENLLSK